MPRVVVIRVCHVLWQYVMFYGSMSCFVVMSRFVVIRHDSHSQKLYPSQKDIPV